ncbi:MAG: hypothetical protein V8R91_06245 [Butyricimonas faecihominis]
MRCVGGNRGDEDKTDMPVLYNSRVYNKLTHDTYVSGKDEVAGTTMYDKSSVRVAKTDFLKMRSLSLNYLIPSHRLSAQVNKLVACNPIAQSVICHLETIARYQIVQ